MTDIAVPPDSPTVLVKSATYCKAYVPFTALPRKYAGKRLALVVVPDDFGVPWDEDFVPEPMGPTPVYLPDSLPIFSK